MVLRGDNFVMMFFPYGHHLNYINCLKSFMLDYATQNKCVAGKKSTTIII